MIKALLEGQIKAAVNNHRPLLIALVGSNGSGKSTFYRQMLSDYELPLINPDEIGKQIRGHYLAAYDPISYDAMELADAARHQLVQQRQSFIMETVLSDTQGSKLSFFREAIEAGYYLLLIYIRINTAEISAARVMQRVLAGGHDVADEKLMSRFARTQRNAAEALGLASFALLLDNSSVETPFAYIQTWQAGKPLDASQTL